MPPGRAPDTWRLPCRNDLRLRTGLRVRRPRLRTGRLAGLLAELLAGRQLRVAHGNSFSRGANAAPSADAGRNLAAPAADAGAFAITPPEQRNAERSARARGYCRRLPARA